MLGRKRKQPEIDNNNYSGNDDDSGMEPPRKKSRANNASVVSGSSPVTAPSLLNALILINDGIEPVAKHQEPVTHTPLPTKSTFFAAMPGSEATARATASSRSLAK
jgi:hypothetical protein